MGLVSETGNGLRGPVSQPLPRREFIPGARHAFKARTLHRLPPHPGNQRAARLCLWVRERHSGGLPGRGGIFGNPGRHPAERGCGRDGADLRFGCGGGKADWPPVARSFFDGSLPPFRPRSAGSCCMRWWALFPHGWPWASRRASRGEERRRAGLFAVPGASWSGWPPFFRWIPLPEALWCTPSSSTGSG